MSLKIWLPLTGSLDNQGLLNLPTPWDARTKDTGGKIGQHCYSDNAIYHIENEWLGNEWSLACWVKSSSWSQYNDIILCKNTTSSGSAQFYLSIIGGTWLNIGCNAGSETLKINYTFAINTWYHVAATYDGTTLKLYLNGNEVGTKAYTSTQKTGMNNLGIGCRSANAAGTSATGGGGKRMNDVRIYDHCLSPLEIKQISQGLILHYKFEIGTSELKTSILSTNVYSYPTFNTSSGSGGWSHWGASGHSGHYGQNTDKNYIFNKDNSYSHWVSNDESATKDYLLYQSPAFEGGHRSLQCIVKEENGKPITQDICYPAWNARNGGTPAGLWTSIIPLNDDFYLCKCQNIQQNGSNDLVGIDVKIGYKVYFSECYLENDVQKCSSCFNSIEKFQDSSGYNHNGLLYKYDTNGNFNFIKDTPRYNTCIYIDSVNNTTNTASGTVYIYGDCKLTNPTQMTIAFWCKPIAGYGGGTTQGQFCTTNIAFGNNAGSDYQASAMNHRDGTIDTNDSASSTQCRPTINFIANEWHHYVFTYNGKDAKSYRDGILQDIKSFSESKTLDSFIGVIIGFSKAGGVWRSNKSYYSDFRVYCTALNQNDIKKLYNVNMSVDNFNNIHTFELKESNSRELLHGRRFTTGYSNHNSLISAQPNFLNGELFLNGNGKSVGSDYIQINPTGKTYYYDIDVSINTGNQFYIGFERYDIDKTARSNQACVYVVAIKPTSDLIHKRYRGVVNLSTDGVNPCAFIALRILSGWSGTTSGVTGVATVHRLSLREVITLQQPKLYEEGILLGDEFNEHQKASFYSNGIIEAVNYIEK